MYIASLAATLCHQGFGNLLAVSASKSCSQRLLVLAPTLRSVDFNPMLSSTTCLSSFYFGLSIISYFSMQRARKFTPNNSTSDPMMKTTKMCIERIMLPSKICRVVLWRIKRPSLLLRDTVSLGMWFSLLRRILLP
jgi:hypothetical protein